MNLFLKELRMKCRWVVSTVVLCSCLLGITPIWGYESSGLSFRLFADQDHPDLKYIRGEEAITILVVMTNDAGVPVATKRGFSEIELHRTLTVTDPFGARHFLGDEQETHKMPMPYFLNGKAWEPAEELPKNWVRSAKIEDLSELVPIMKTTPGWYTIQGLQFFARYASTGIDSDYGFLGMLTHPNNWKGAIESNTLQIYVAPMSGGQVRVQVVDETPDPAKPLGQVPVKIFKSADIPAGSTLETTWDRIPPVLLGTTDFDGYATWEASSRCLVSDNYTVLAKYGGEIKSESVSRTETGWANECTGNIAKVMRFVEKVVEVNIVISGGAYNFPQTATYRATFSMDVSRTKGVPSGWLKYYYTRTRMNFVSTGITEVSGTKPNLTIKGVGTVNNVSGYSFEATVVDGSPDSFGIIIKRADGSAYYSAPTKANSGGDLTITVQ